MKQHAIPQNILEVEFKLFTKFTVREFAYVAIGIGFGGIFLYLFSKGYMPALMAIPIFIVSSAIGLGLALVPVNDQNADVFMRNFFSAIRKPTLRVWRSERFDEKFNLLAQQRGIDLTQTTGTMNRTANSDEQSNTRVVGGTAKSLPAAQFMNQETIEQIDQEEIQRIQQLEQVAVEELGPPPQQYQPVQEPVSTTPTVQINYDEIMNQPHIEATLNPSAQATSDQPMTIQGDQVDISSIQAPTITDDQDQSAIPPFPVQGTVPIRAMPGEDPQIETRPDDQSISDTNQLSNEQTVHDSGSEVSTVSESREILIDKNTAAKFHTEVEGYTPKEGNIALFVSNKDDIGVAQATILIKNEQGNIVQALQSDPQGLVFPKKQLPKGSYRVTIEHDRYNFPVVNFILEDQALPVVNIDSVNDI